MYFSIFTLVFTTLDSFCIGLFIFVFSLISLFFIFLVSHYKRGISIYTSFIKRLLFLCLSFVLSLGAVIVKQSLYFSKQPSPLSYKTGSIIYNTTPVPQSKFFIGTGHIIDKTGQGKYIFQDSQFRKYTLNSQKEYLPGSLLRITGYFKPAFTLSLPLDKGVLEWDLYNAAKGDFYKFLSGISSIYTFNYPKRQLMKGLYGNIYEQNSIILSTENIGLLSSLRRDLQTSVVSSYGKNRIGGLILGLLVGDKSYIPDTDYDNFIMSSLVHIIAVSGGNIVMLVTFLGFVLIFLPFYIRNFVILCFVVMYSFLCGMDSSVFRAMIMGSLSLIAIFRGREINIRRSMSIAYIAMLLVNPYFLFYDIGFIFSFSAIIGIVLFSKHSLFSDFKNKLKSFSNSIYKSYLQPTIGATLGVFPFMIFFIGKLNILGIFANLIILPIIPIVMIYGVVSLVLFKLSGRVFFIKLETYLIHYIYIVSEQTIKYGLYLEISDYYTKLAILLLFALLFLSTKYGRIQEE